VTTLTEPSAESALVDPNGLIDALPVAVVLTDQHGQLLRCNAVARSWLDAWQDDDSTPALDRLLTVPSRVFMQTHVWPTVLRDGLVAEAYLELRQPSGTNVPVLLNGHRLNWEGRPSYCWVLLQATQRSRFEAELLHARARAEAALAQLMESQAALRRTGALAAVGGWEWDPATSVVTVSQELADLLETGSGARNPSDLMQQLGPRERFRLLRAGMRSVRQQRGLDETLTMASGSSKHLGSRVLHIVGVPELRAGTGRVWVGAAQDVSERHRLMKALAEQSELLQVTLHSIGDAVITTDAQGVVTWLNPVAEAMTGWPTDEARGQSIHTVFHIVHELTRAPAANPVDACLSKSQVVWLAEDTALLARDGREYGIEDSAAPIMRSDGQLIGAVLVFHDVTQRRRLANEMKFRSQHDSLTGLVNRAEFGMRLNQAFDRACTQNVTHTVMALDLDRFKVVNDTCGHAAGDRLLQQVSRLFQECLRARDTLARLGGDEFSVLLEHCTVEQAERVGRQICARLDDFRFEHEGKRFRVGVSIGLAPIDARWESADMAMHAADAACLAAKDEGRNRVHVWIAADASINERQGQIRWASTLEEALDEDRFVLYGQRIEPVERSDAIPHAEVLLRLRGHDGVLINPGAFMPAAERFHLATRIDRWVIRKVLQVLRQDEGALRGNLSVNLSGLSVADRVFQQDVLAELASLPMQLRKALWLEITETAAITHLNEASQFVNALRCLGVRVALDDFGAGASSFGYLRGLDVDALKIDGQFITNLDRDELNAVTVRCFVEVAAVKGLLTVAEFVDCDRVMERIKGLGVGYAQGYLLHKPEPLADLMTTWPTPTERPTPPI